MRSVVEATYESKRASYFGIHSTFTPKEYCIIYSRYDTFCCNVIDERTVRIIIKNRCCMYRKYKQHHLAIIVLVLSIAFSAKEIHAVGDFADTVLRAFLFFYTVLSHRTSEDSR